MAAAVGLLVLMVYGFARCTTSLKYSGFGRRPATSIQDLLVSLESDDPNVRWAAARDLGRYDEEGGEAVAALLSRVEGDAEPRVRHEAFASILLIDPHALRIWASSDSNARPSRVDRLLQEMVCAGPLGRRAKPLLLELLTDAQSVTKLAAIQAIGLSWATARGMKYFPLGTVELECEVTRSVTQGEYSESSEADRLAMAQSLLPLLSSSAEGVQAAIAIALGRMTAHAALPELERLATTDDPTVHEAAQRAIRAIERHD